MTAVLMIAADNAV